MCITDRHDMTLAVKVELNPNTTNQSWYIWLWSVQPHWADLLYKSYKKYVAGVKRLAR